MTALVITEFVVAIVGLTAVLSAVYVSMYGFKRPEKKEDTSVILQNPRYIMYTQAPKKQCRQTNTKVRHHAQPQRRYS